MTRVAIVCGYGTDAARLASYANGIISHARALRLDLIVTSGGATGRDDVTEADVLADLLRPAGVRILREPHARSTAENLLLSRELLTREGINTGSLTIFCDRIRRMKVAALSRIVFPPPVDVIAVGRHGGRWLYFAQIPSTLWQLAVVTTRMRRTRKVP